MLSSVKYSTVVYKVGTEKLRVTNETETFHCPQINLQQIHLIFNIIFLITSRGTTLWLYLKFLSLKDFMEGNAILFMFEKWLI
jgi:hypothetical protein